MRRLLDGAFAAGMFPAGEEIRPGGTDARVFRRLRQKLPRRLHFKLGSPIASERFRYLRVRNVVGL